MHPRCFHYILDTIYQTYDVSLFLADSVPTLMPTGEVPDHYDDLPSVTA